MEDYLNKALELLDKIALDVVMLEGDNIPGFRVVLNRFDVVNRLLADNKGDSLAEFGKVVKSVVEAILLGDIPAEEGIKKVADGVSLFQEILRDEQQGQSYSGKVTRFLETHGISPAVTTSSSSDETEDASEAQETKEHRDDQKGGKEILEPIEDKELLLNFIAESQDHLEAIEVNILTLEQYPEDMDAINAIFRPFHTIKGVAGFLNLGDINRLSHEVETLLDKARNQDLIINEEIIDIVLEALDLMKRLINHLKEDIDSGFITSAGIDLETFIDKLKIAGRSNLKDEQAQEDDSTAPRTPPKDGAGVDDILIEKESPEQTELEEVVKKQQDHKGDKKFDEKLISDKKASTKDVTHALKEQKKRHDKKLATKKNNGDQPAFIRVDTKKLDNMVDMVGELVITQSMIQENAGLAASKDQKLYRNLAQLGRITSEVQRISMSMRMVLIKQTFHKMMRLVRDLSKKAGKLVNLEIYGEDTEIDRNMVEEIYDPLVHMIRNSIDHGIEMPDVRKSAKKPETGTVTLKAYHKGGNIIIEVTDDGKGLDRAKIRKKALERRLVKPDEKISDQEINALIFQPGFSTADHVTNVSGRGVGMDVVKRTVDSMRGKLEVRSEKGGGTTVVMRLPLTLAIIDGMLVRVGGKEYIIPTISVVESLRPDQESCSTVAGRGEMVKIRDTILPLVRLHKLFGFEPQHYNPWEAIIVVIENEGRRKCLLVDELIGKNEIVIKSLGEKLKNIKGLAGGAILADGRVGLILDAAGIFEISEKL